MPSPRATLALAITLVAILTLLPRPALRSVTYLHQPVTFLLTPIQQPVRTLVVWLQGPVRPRGASASVPVASESPDVIELQRQRDDLLRQLLHSKQEADTLRDLVRNLSRGFELNPALNVKMIPASVIGFGSDLSGGLLSVRAGKRDGVDANAVVVVSGVNLVGRVQRADDRTCAVMPINDPAFIKSFKSQKFSGVIMLDDQTRGPTWNLESIDDGLLVGKVYFDKDNTPGADHPTITPDMLVRLRDDNWPASAQMLVIGRVLKVEAGSHDRPIVTVQPLQDVSRVSEVMIRVSGTETAGVKP